MGTYFMKLAPAHQPGHFVARLELFKADDAFGVIAIFVHAVLFSGNVGEHASGSMAVSVRWSLAGACAAHTTSASGGQASRRLHLWSRRSVWSWRGRMKGDALFNMLRPCRVITIRSLLWQLSSADGAFVLFGDLTLGSRVQLLDRRWPRGYEELPWKHVACPCRT